MIHQKIQIDITEKTPLGYVYAKQGDANSRYIDVELMNSGMPYEVQNDTIARFRLRKPDGTQIFNNAEIHNNIITVELTEQALAVHGVAVAEVALYSGTSLLTSEIFMIKIVSSAISEEQIKSSDEYKSLTAALALVEYIEELAETTATTANETFKKLKGYSVGGTGSNGEIWGYIPLVKNDGGVEVGQYIDLHLTSNDNEDRIVRMRIYKGENEDFPTLKIEGTAYGSLANIVGNHIHGAELHGDKIFGTLGFPLKLTFNGKEYAYALNSSSAADFANKVKFYAPTTAGNNNQILLANKNGAPSWADSAPLATAFKNDTDIITFIEFYNAFTAALSTINGDFNSLKNRFPVKNADISEKAIDESKIQAGAVTQGKIKDGAVTNGKLGEKSVSESKIQAGAVTQPKIKDGAVSPGKIEAAAQKDRVLVTMENGGKKQVSWSQIYNWMIGEKTIALDRLALGEQIASWLAVGMQRQYMPVLHCKDSSDSNHRDGWLINWCRETAWYIGGFGADCGGHPPYTSNNKTSWVLAVLNGVKTSENEDGYNHRLQIAFDIQNSKIYMRRGWVSSNTWVDKWTEIGEIADGSITAAKLSTELQNMLAKHESGIGTLSDLKTENKNSVVEAVNEVKAEAESLIAANDALVFKGVISTEEEFQSVWIDGNEFHTGWTWKVGSHIPYDRLWHYAPVVEVGDMIIAIKDSDEYTAVNSDVSDYFTIVQANIDGAVTGAPSSVSGNVPIFNGTTGKVIKDSGHKLEADVPANAKFTDTVYTHPTTAGNKHIPTGGAENQILKWNSNGAAKWADSAPLATAFKNGSDTITFATFYNAFVSALSELCNVDNTSDQEKPVSTAQQEAIQAAADEAVTAAKEYFNEHGVTGAPSSVSGNVPIFDGTTGKVLKDSGHKLEADVPANAKFTDTVYTHPTTAGNKHIPTGGNPNHFLTYGGSSGSAKWQSIEDIYSEAARRAFIMIAKMDGYSETLGEVTLSEPSKIVITGAETSISVQCEGKIHITNATISPYTFIYKLYDSASSSEIPAFTTKSIEIPPNYCLSAEFDCITFAGTTTYHCSTGTPTVKPYTPFQS